MSDESTTRTLQSEQFHPQKWHVHSKSLHSSEERLREKQRLTCASSAASRVREDSLLFFFDLPFSFFLSHSSIADTNTSTTLNEGGSRPSNQRDT